MALVPVLTISGCQNLFGPKGPPRDPLLIVRKPIDGKPVAGPPIHIAYSEPDLPRDAVLRENAPGIAGTAPRRVPATLTNRVIDPSIRQGPRD